MTVCDFFFLRWWWRRGGNQTGERRAWSISWYQLRRCPLCNISGKRRKKWLEVFVGVYKCASLCMLCVLLQVICLEYTHLATALRQHAWSDLLLCTRPTHRELRALIVIKDWNNIASGQVRALTQTAATTPGCYFTHLSTKSMYFVANKHKPRGSVHTTLLLRSRAHLCSIYPQIIPKWHL